MFIQDRFKNKIAIVTGAASGIGNGVAHRLGAEGAKLYLLDFNQNALENAEKEFAKGGLRAKGIVTDISKEEQVQKAISQIEKAEGRIDILVHCAGIVGPTSTKITEYSTDDFDRIYRINLRGSFLITKYTLEVMKRKGEGRILLIASIAGKEGNPGMAGYSSTKSGMIGLIKGVAKEFANTRITVNGVAPAVIRTAMNENTSKEQLRYMTAKIPMGRLGTVEEVAAMISFIVSDENSFSTGFIYDISGGRATY